jgi:D-alanine-D-alanine ligase
MWDQTYADSELPSDEETAEEVEFVSRALGLEDGEIILDLCCGQGRHSVRLADMGYSVIGLDSSRTLLDLARDSSRLESSPQRIVASPRPRVSASHLWFVQGDMRNIPIREGVCDAVINLFTSFGFFDDAGNLRVLEAAASVLKPGGKLLLDYWNPYAAAQLDGTRNWWWISENLLALAEARYDFSSGRLRDMRTIVDIEKSSVEDVVREVRFYTLPELEEMLEKAGLHILAVYGDLDEREYDGESRRLITVSEKQ